MVHVPLPDFTENSEHQSSEGEAPKDKNEAELGPPDPKRPRQAPPAASVSFVHPVSELIQKHQGAIFNFRGIKRREKCAYFWLIITFNISNG